MIFITRGVSLNKKSISQLYPQQNLFKNDKIRLTDTGKDGLIYNGVTDWLYEGMTNTTDANDGYFNFFRGSFVHNSAI